jgi:hypothetical protein
MIDFLYKCDDRDLVTDYLRYEKTCGVAETCDRYSIWKR